MYNITIHIMTSNFYFLLLLVSFTFIIFILSYTYFVCIMYITVFNMTIENISNPDRSN